MRAVFSAVDQPHGSRLFPLLRIMSCFLGEERPNQKTVAAAALLGRAGGIRSSPRSNAKGRHQVVEFIADTKLIGNKMGCRRVMCQMRMMRPEGELWVSWELPPTSYRCHRPSEARMPLHCILRRRSQPAGCAHRLIPPVLCVLWKSHGDALSGARPGATGPPGWAPAAVVEYWKSCVSEDEFYF